MVTSRVPLEISGEIRKFFLESLVATWSVKVFYLSKKMKRLCCLLPSCGLEIRDNIDRDCEVRAICFRTNLRCRNRKSWEELFLQ